MSSPTRRSPRQKGLECTLLTESDVGAVYAVGECRVIQTDGRHFSISHPERYPTWDEIACARYALLPSLRDCVMVLPPHDEYANLHPNCFHVHLLRELGPGGRFHNPESW